MRSLFRLVLKIARVFTLIPGERGRSLRDQGAFLVRLNRTTCLLELEDVFPRCFVIILNTEAAVDAFARGGNLQFGGALSVAAGPVGRTAEVGLVPVAAVYTYSRSQGLFAGASLEGTIFVEQSDNNASYYRRRVTPKQILRGRVAPPASAEPLLVALRKY